MSPSLPEGAASMIDWDAWRPTQTATLMVVQRDGQLLLIHKKRGLGAGKINAPGGRLEPGETPLDAALRETREEVGIDPVEPRPAGRLEFAFVDGLGIRCHVFHARQFRGVPVETPEAKPFWCALEALPYDRMWADDRLWFPLLLEGSVFHGQFVFDGDTMLWHDLRVTPASVTS